MFDLTCARGQTSLVGNDEREALSGPMGRLRDAADTGSEHFPDDAKRNRGGRHASTGLSPEAPLIADGATAGAGAG